MQWPVSQIAARAPAETARLRELDKRHVWHPFTQMRDWCAPDHDPLVITGGEGPWLFDSEGNAYFDGNSSIWTCIHGHRHPRLDGAIREQLEKLAHCSALGFTNEPAIRLAEKLVQIAPGEELTRVFYSDDGSTAIECACKMAIQYWQLQGKPKRSTFLAFDGAYHGDTMGAASLGGIRSFHERFADFGFEVRRISDLDSLGSVDPDRIAGVTIEPLIQGVARMRKWPAGMLAGLRDWCDRHGVLLILDEVMTGFGRTGTMFACQQEKVAPDLIALAKGLTGGYMPLAATLATERIFEAFLGTVTERKTFYYGHSYCANPLGCAVALANLEIFERENVLDLLQPKIDRLTELLSGLSTLDHVGNVRQCGFIAGIDVVGKGGEPYDPDHQTGARVCIAARKHGLLTRPILDTIVLMPPLCSTAEHLDHAVEAIERSIDEVCASP